MIEYGILLLLLLAAIIRAARRLGFEMINPAIFIFAANYVYNFVLFPIGVEFVPALAGDYEKFLFCTALYGMGIVLGIFLLGHSIQAFTARLHHRYLGFRWINLPLASRNEWQMYILFCGTIYLAFSALYGSFNPLEMLVEGNAFKHEIQGSGLSVPLSIMNSLVLSSLGVIIVSAYMKKLTPRAMALAIVVGSITMTYFGSKGLILLPIYILFIVRTHYMAGKWKLAVFVLVALLLVVVPTLDVLRFGRESQGDVGNLLLYNFLRRTWDNIYVSTEIINGTTDVSSVHPISIFLQQFLPRALYSDKSYPFEAIVTQLVMSDEYGDGYVWKADIGGIPEFFMLGGYAAVLLLGMLNAMLLIFYATWLDRARHDANHVSYLIGIFSIGSYSAFNIGISAKLMDLSFHFLYAVATFTLIAFLRLALRPSATSTP